ncbi:MULTISPECIES: hypothetical protein [unclassified Mesorhizobium]|uniref:hypothetical protein n=1 Tax=unclassified Mesorhizobium TaxID=325217 RepID=UPI0012DDA660|nr:MULTISPECIES: hypothetical protein [unclassified Mesorhizobium]WJI50223.1 hypothetical protein NLY44_27150 [Mesorhizobium sp. C089B]
MDNRNLLRIVILSGWVLSGTIALAVIISIIALSFQGKQIPQILGNFGGVIIGFFFGQFASFVKDALLPSDKAVSDVRGNIASGNEEK